MSRSTAAVGGAGASNADISFIEFEHAVEQVRALRAEGQDSSPVMSQLISETKARLMRKFGLSDPRLARTVQYLEGDPRAPTPNEIRLIWENYKNTSPASSAAGGAGRAGAGRAVMTDEEWVNIRFNRIKRGIYDRLSQQGQELLDRIQHELRGKTLDTMTGRFTDEDYREFTHMSEMIKGLMYAYSPNENDLRIDWEDDRFMLYLGVQISDIIDEARAEAAARLSARNEAPAPSAFGGAGGASAYAPAASAARGAGGASAYAPPASAARGVAPVASAARGALMPHEPPHAARNYSAALAGEGGPYAPADFGAGLALMPQEPPHAGNEARNYNGLRRPEMTEENINRNIDEAIEADRGVWRIGTRRIPPRGGSRKHRTKRKGKGKKSTIKRRF